ncbi:MAG: CvpA family protein [Clostridiaceae bacterium]|nr:CvpA family protein [Clostridiaceae bacterium]
MKLDIFIVAIIVLMTIFGYRRGLLLSAVSFLSSLISIGIAFLFVRPLSLFLTSQGLFSSTMQNVTNRIYETGRASAVTIGPVLEEIGIPESWTRTILQTQTGSKVDVVDYTAHALWMLASAALALAIIYLFVRIILGFAARLLTPAIDGVPIVGWLNHLGGSIIGMLWGATVIALSIMVLVSLSGALPSIAEWTQDSKIISFLTEKDIIRSLLDTIL